MKVLLQSFALSAGLLMAAQGFAQTPAVPAKPMVPAPMAAPAAAAAPATPAAPAVASAKPTAKQVYKVPAAAAPGGGDGKVWVNSGSKVYHCPGTKYYGKTKAGEYMSEADAKAKGNHPVNKKTCS